MHAESRFSLSSWMGFELMRRKVRAVTRPDMLVLNTRMSWSDLWTPTLAHYCDWSITDFGFHGNRSRQPRTVFVTPRFPYLAHFFDRVLPMIDRGTRFVLVTGAADLTVPRQLDCRGASFEGTAMRAHFDALLRDQRLLRWHADNVDAASAGIRPIPCGSAGRYGGCPSARIDRFVTPVSLGGRLIRALCMHHVRRGDQWERRRTVTMLAQTQWADAVDTLPAVPEREFFSTLRRYAFTICATGGGVDPSPKAWAAMLAGSIPIVERGPMESAYRDLPIAWVDEWSEDSISPQRLDEWLSSLRRHYEDPELRRLMVHRLSMGYWWRKLNDGSTSMWPAPVGASG